MQVWKVRWYNKKRSRPDDARLFTANEVPAAFLDHGRPQLRPSRLGTNYVLFYDKLHGKWSGASSHTGAPGVPPAFQRDPVFTEATAAESQEFRGGSDDETDDDDSDDDAVPETRRAAPPRRVQTRSRMQRSDVGMQNLLGGLNGRRTRRRRTTPQRFAP